LVVQALYGYAPGSSSLRRFGRSRSPMSSPPDPAGISRAVVIATTPRSGSFYLSELLWNTQVCGHPSEYVRREDTPIWHTLLGCRSYEDYIDAYLTRGWSQNGVFGAKLMWEQFIRFVTDLTGRHNLGDQEIAALLASAFGQCKYVFLCRADTLRQSISYFRALKTGRWHRTVHSSLSPSREETFDGGAIAGLRVELEDQINRWKEFFQRTGAEFITVYYEELERQPQRCLSNILDFLGIPSPIAVVDTSLGLLKQSDEVTERWLTMFEMHRRAATEVAPGSAHDAKNFRCCQQDLASRKRTST
jgi:LPS sulfotransferase NodH